MLERSCIACRKKDRKNNLYRIVSNDNEMILDNEQKINSRGIYLCKEVSCIDRLIKSVEKNKINLKITLDKNSLIRTLNELRDELMNILNEK